MSRVGSNFRIKDVYHPVFWLVNGVTSVPAHAYVGTPACGTRVEPRCA
jgi:hypothetical protein